MHSIRLYHMRYTGSKRARGPTPPHLHKLQTKLGGQRGPAAKIGPLTRHLPRRMGATPSPLAGELYSQLASPGVAQRRPDNDAAAGTPRQLLYCFLKKKLFFKGQPQIITRHLETQGIYTQPAPDQRVLNGGRRGALNPPVNRAANPSIDGGAQPHRWIKSQPGTAAAQW